MIFWDLFNIFTTNNTTDFFHFKFFLKIFSIISSFFSYSIGQNKLVSSNKLLAFNIKRINQIQRFSHISESHACTLKTFVVIFLLPINFLSFFWNMFNSKGQSKLHYHYSHKNLSNEILLIYTHPDLLHKLILHFR